MRLNKTMELIHITYVYQQNFIPHGKPSKYSYLYNIVIVKNIVFLMK